MKLDYDLIEDAFDDTTNIRTMTEQAYLPTRGMLLRTTLYTPHHITMNVTYIPVKKKKQGRKKKKHRFDPVA